MFERYTEAARRVIFHGRYEAARCGSPFIETEHLLVGVLREDRALALQLFGSEEVVGALKAELTSPETANRTSTSVDLPLSQESKRVLAYGAEEAERVQDRHIRPGHLLLGLLREPNSFAALAMRHAGAELSQFREKILGQPKQFSDELHRLVDQLPREQWEAAEQALRSLISGSPNLTPGSLTSATSAGTGTTRAGAAAVGLFAQYTEQARRSIFFARYEASQFGANSIESEHLLLGLLREYPRLVDQLRGKGVAAEGIRKEIERRRPPGEKTPTTVDMPLSKECKRALAFAADEAHQMKHQQIGSGHLLAGLLREETCLAAELVRAHGINLEEARKYLTQGGST
jgi:ATP-dependent Clp protease ATP-binding subunit ClpA